MTPFKSLSFQLACISIYMLLQKRKFTHPNVVLNSYDFISSVERGEFLENVPATEKESSMKVYFKSSTWVWIQSQQLTAHYGRNIR